MSPKPAADQGVAVVAVRVLHHPDGVALPGEIVRLDPDRAARALAVGDAVTPQPDKAPAPMTEESA